MFFLYISEGIDTPLFAIVLKQGWRSKQPKSTYEETSSYMFKFFDFRDIEVPSAKLPSKSIMKNAV
jgi:hypothetical protein